ncbi:UNC93-like protein C922.05c, partial [Trifolium medium]|nr:UNC93-like protein C922.05c [Trifolium medium]
AAVAWQIDNHNVSPMSQLIVNWVLTTVSYPLLLVLMVLAVKEDNSKEEKAEFHVENISPPGHNGSVDC